MTDRLYRSRDDRMLTGVAGGVAEMLDADPSLIRIVWALLIVLTGGIALIVYIVMAIVVPERPAGLPVRGSGPAPWGPATDGPAPGGVAADGRPVDPASPPRPEEPVPEGGWRAPDGSTVPSYAASSAGAPRAARRDPDDRTRAGLLVGLVLIVLGGFFLVRQLLPAFDAGLWWPIVAIIAGIGLILVALLPPRRPS